MEDGGCAAWAQTPPALRAGTAPKGVQLLEPPALGLFGRCTAATVRRPQPTRDVAACRSARLSVCRSAGKGRGRARTACMRLPEKCRDRRADRKLHQKQNPNRASVKPRPPAWTAQLSRIAEYMRPFDNARRAWTPPCPGRAGREPAGAARLRRRATVPTRAPATADRSARPPSPVISVKSRRASAARD